MKTFDEKDLITWSTREKAIVGNQYYFADTPDSMKDKVKRGVVRKLITIDFYNYANTFCSDGLTCYPCILPVEAVKEEKEYRACENVREFFELVSNDECKVSDEECIYQLISDFIIHIRKKITGTEYYCPIKTISVDKDSIIRLSVAHNVLSFNDLFQEYEIKINDKWVPFGVLED